MSDIQLLTLAVVALGVSNLLLYVLHLRTTRRVKNLRHRLWVMRSRGSSSPGGGSGGAEVVTGGLGGFLSSLMEAKTKAFRELREFIHSNRHLRPLASADDGKLFDIEVLREHFPNLVQDDGENGDCNPPKVMRAVLATLHARDIQDEDSRALEVWVKGHLPPASAEGGSP